MLGSSATQKLNEHERRIELLETWRYETEKVLAIRSEKDRHIDDRFDHIEKSIDALNVQFKESMNSTRMDFREGLSELKDSNKKIVFLIIAAIIGAVVDLVIRTGSIN
jgi:hypothetical protein